MYAIVLVSKALLWYSLMHKPEPSPSTVPDILFITSMHACSNEVHPVHAAEGLYIIISLHLVHENNIMLCTCTRIPLIKIYR